MKVEGIAVSLTLIETQAVYIALGKMFRKDYANDEEADAGARVYNKLTPLLMTMALVR